MDDQGFGSVENVLLQLEGRLSDCTRENRALGSLVDDLRRRLATAEQRHGQAQQRLADMQEQAHKEAAAREREAKKAEAKHTHAASNSRLLLGQAKRAQRQAEQALAAVQQRADAAEDRAAAAEQQADSLRQRLAAAEQRCKALGLELQQHADHPGRQEAVAAAAAATAAASSERSRAEAAEARCDELERHLQMAQEALREVERTATARRQLPPPAAGGAAASFGQAASLPLWQLADLEDLVRTAQEGCSSQDSPDAGSPRQSEGGSEWGAQEAQMRALLMQLQQQLERQEVEQGRAAAARQPQEQLPPNAQAAVGQELEVAGRQVAKLQARNARLQTALADAHLALSRGGLRWQAELQALRGELQAVRRELDDVSRSGVGSSAAAAAQEAERLASQVAEYATRLAAALEQNGALLQEKERVLEALAAAEAQLEEARGEAARLRMQRLCLAPGAGAGGTAAERLLLEAQAAEAALRSVLAEARQQQLAACRSLSAELRRCHALEAGPPRCAAMALSEEADQQPWELEQLAPDAPKLAAEAEAPGAVTATFMAVSGQGGKRRVRWTPDLHAVFLRATDIVGGVQVAKPKDILGVMGVEDLQVAHVKSHLQKYRMSLGIQAGKKRRRTDSGSDDTTSDPDWESPSQGPSADSGHAVPQGAARRGVGRRARCSGERGSATDKSSGEASAPARQGAAGPSAAPAPCEGAPQQNEYSLYLAQLDRLRERQAQAAGPPPGQGSARPAAEWQQSTIAAGLGSVPATAARWEPRAGTAPPAGGSCFHHAQPPPPPFHDVRPETGSSIGDGGGAAPAFGGGADEDGAVAGVDPQLLTALARHRELQRQLVTAVQVHQSVLQTLRDNSSLIRLLLSRYPGPLSAAAAAAVAATSRVPGAAEALGPAPGGAAQRHLRSAPPAPVPQHPHAPQHLHAPQRLHAPQQLQAPQQLHVPQQPQQRFDYAHVQVAGSTPVRPPLFLPAAGGSTGLLEGGGGCPPGGAPLPLLGQAEPPSPLPWTALPIAAGEGGSVVESLAETALPPSELRRPSGAAAPQGEHWLSGINLSDLQDLHPL
eukprot:scaffold3.g6443.t1